MCRPPVLNMKYTTILVGWMAAILTASASYGQGFLVLQELSFINQPADSEFEHLGIMTDHVVYQVDLGAPSVESMVRLAARMSVGQSYHDIVQMDHEYWENNLNRVSLDSAKASVRLMCETLRWFKSEQPELKVGFYGFVPIRDIYAYRTKPDSIRWAANNNLLQPLADSVDYLCPSLYAFHADTAHYANYARAIIGEAKRLSHGKPVYPYVSPQFHPSGSRYGQFLSHDYFALVLKTVKEAGADGVVIWGGSDAMDDIPHIWDSTWGWWMATKEFMASLALASKDHPQVPSILSPRKGSLDQPTSFVARWQSSHAADLYHLQLADNIAFRNPILDDSTITDTIRNIPRLEHNSKYYLRIRARGSRSWTGYSVAADFVTARSDLAVEQEEIPRETALGENFPNPFNPVTVITSQLSVASDVKIVVFDLLGREVATLVDGPRAAGYYRDRFDGRGLASGVYLCRMQARPLDYEASGFVKTRKLVLLK